MIEDDDYAPKQKPDPFPPIVFGGEGINVHGLGDDLLITGTQQEAVEEEVTTTEATDPTQHAAFRIRVFENGSNSYIGVNAGYVTYIEWAGSVWNFDSLYCAPSEILRAEVYTWVFLVIPVTRHTSLAECPFATTTGVSSIDGSYFAFTVDTVTEWHGPSIAAQAPGFVPVQTNTEGFDTASTTEFRLLLGYVTAEGEVQQLHIGNTNLPQGFNPRIHNLTVVPV